MYELDNRKDQVMSVYKMTLANLAMWVRDRYFPASYAQATWKHLLPFFQLPGTITHSAQMVQVELRPFNDRALNRDLAILCERVNQTSPHLPDGRYLTVYQIALNMPNNPLKCIGSLYHCDATVLLRDDDEREPD